MPDPREFLAALEAQHRAADSASAKSMAIARSARAINEAYKLARLEGSSRNFNPPGRSGNAAIYESHDLMHRRVRSQYLNNSIFRRSTHILRDLIVGSGISAFSDPIDYTFGWQLDARPEAELMLALDYALESDEKFEAWAEDKNQVDAQGKLSWPDMQRQIIQEIILVGSVLRVKCARPGQPVPICYQLVEREQIHTEMDRPGGMVGGRWQNAIINGFEIDRDGREVAVYLWKDHPYADVIHTGGSKYEHERIPASRYDHHYLSLRPSQTVGATWLHTIGQPAKDRDDFTDAELRSAVKAARHLLVAKLKNPMAGAMGFEDLIDSEPDEYGRPELALGSDPVAAEIGTDEELELIEPHRPTDKANNFFDIIDHDIANGTDASYYSLTGRFNETNYGGFRGAMNLEVAQMRPLQEWLGRNLVKPVRREWNRLAVGLGHIQTVSPSQFVRDETRYQRFDVIGPGRALLDPDKEADGDLTELRGGLDTLKRKCAQRQLHWIKVLRQMALENRIAGLLGVILDHSKGQGGQTEKSTRSSDADSAANRTH